MSPPSQPILPAADALYGPELLRYVESVRSSRLLILVLALTTACGQAGATNPRTPPASTRSGGPHPQVALAGFAARTARAGSARVAMHMTMSGVSSDGAIDVDATGVVAFGSRAGEMQMRMTSPTTGSVLHMREITLWPVVYMRSSLFASEPHSKGPWVKLDLARIERRHGVNVNALANTGGNDPSEMLSTLAGESDSITTVGHALVRGVRTTHYRAVIDLSKVAASAPPRAAGGRAPLRGAPGGNARQAPDAGGRVDRRGRPGAPGRLPHVGLDPRPTGAVTTRCGSRCSGSACLCT